MAGEGAHWGCQGDVRFTYCDVDYFCCHGALVSYCIKWHSGPTPSSQEISCLPHLPSSCWMPQSVAFLTTGDTVRAPWVPSLHGVPLPRDREFDWRKEALTSSHIPLAFPGRQAPISWFGGESPDFEDPSVPLCKLSSEVMPSRSLDTRADCNGEGTQTLPPERRRPR